MELLTRQIRTNTDFVFQFCFSLADFDISSYSPDSWLALGVVLDPEMVPITRPFGAIAALIFALVLTIGMMSSGVDGGSFRLRSFFRPSLFGLIANGNSKPTTEEHGASVVGDYYPRRQEDRTDNRNLVSENGIQKRARVAYFIMCGGSDVERLNLLLPAIYHPDNIYLVHIDAKAQPEEVRVLYPKTSGLFFHSKIHIFFISFRCIHRYIWTPIVISIYFSLSLSVLFTVLTPNGVCF